MGQYLNLPRAIVAALVGRNSLLMNKLNDEQIEKFLLAFVNCYP
jgi:hypothetical protein